ncbi:P-loop NTPase fold protein [Microcoleus sp. Pol11C2]|uniref:P-loop NTPase fold protein n=1 Tax=Microcoleus sp. Pol11C2 TaxID=3055389 RepID=UPI002FD181ED
MPDQVNIANNQYVSEPNKHIEEYLNYYCELSHSPKFAILLKGKWGSGKTWFINQYIEKLKAKEKKCLYVSLYGATNYSEIEDLLMQQLYPFRTSKGMVIAGKVFKGLLKGALKIDLNNDGKDDMRWNFSIPDINIPQKFEDSSFSLLIFDDLERCSINIENILGYINSFVESQYLKVVIIANEEEISTEPEKYKKIKEKLIGKSFEISPDFSGALNEVLNQVHTQQAKDFLSKNLDFIQDLYRQAECMNLRILNQISLDFERFFKELPEKARNKAELIKDLLELLIIFSIEISCGRLEPKDISQIDQKLGEELVLARRAAKDTDSKENQANTEDKKSFMGIFKKYENIYNMNYSSVFSPFFRAFPNLSVWGLFFDKGIIHKEAVEKSLLTSKYFKDENSPNWIKLLHYEQLSDDEFEKLIELVNLEYQKRDYDDINIIKHITGLFLKFSEVGLYPKTKENILDDAKLYINELRNNNKLDFHFPEDLRQAYGFAFPSNSLEFEEFCEYIKQSKNEVKINKAPDAARDLLRIMQTDTDKFSSMIGNKLNYIKNMFKLNESYFDFPIFNYMSPKEFVETILKLENTERDYVFYSLQQRYAIQNHDLNQEINFLIEVQKILLQEVEQRQGKLMGYLLKQANQFYLEPIIVGLKQNRA